MHDPLIHRTKISLQLARSPGKDQDGLVYLSQVDVIALLGVIEDARHCLMLMMEKHKHWVWDQDATPGQAAEMERARAGAITLGTIVNTRQPARNIDELKGRMAKDYGSYSGEGNEGP